MKKEGHSCRSCPSQLEKGVGGTYLLKGHGTQVRDQTSRLQQPLWLGLGEGPCRPLPRVNDLSCFVMLRCCFPHCADTSLVDDWFVSALFRQWLYDTPSPTTPTYYLRICLMELIFSLYFYFMWTSVFPVCMSVHDVCAVPVETRREHWITRLE